jgi:hypothetical protein
MVHVAVADRAGQDEVPELIAAIGDRVIHVSCAPFAVEF